MKRPVSTRAENARLGENAHALITDIITWYDEAKGMRNKWFHHEGMHVYVRRSIRYIQPPRRTEVLDLATFEFDEQIRGQGAFTAMLDTLMARRIPVYVESILNPRLVRFLSGKGFVIVRDELSPSMAWLPPT
jgi:hypothetical protein